MEHKSNKAQRHRATVRLPLDPVPFSRLLEADLPAQQNLLGGRHKRSGILAKKRVLEGGFWEVGLSSARPVFGVALMLILSFLVVES